MEKETVSHKRYFGSSLEQQTATLTISCKWTHVFLMRPNDGLKVDVVFLQSWKTLEESGMRRRNLHFITNRAQAGFHCRREAFSANIHDFSLALL